MLLLRAVTSLTVRSSAALEYRAWPTAPKQSFRFRCGLRRKAEGLARKALETVFAVAKEMGYVQIWGSIHRRNEPTLRIAESMGFISGEMSKIQH